MRDAGYVKRSYESLNGQVREGKNAVFQDVHLFDDDPITVLEIGEAVEMIANGKIMVFFGANWCPWCRNAIMVLAEAAKEDGFRIYYVDMDQKRPTYRYDDGRIVNVVKATADYERLAKIMDDILLPYPLKDAKGNMIDNPYKVLSLPLVVSFDCGKIEGYHYGAVELKEGQTPYDLLDQDQREELAGVYRNLSTKSYIGMACDINGECK